VAGGCDCCDCWPAVSLTQTEDLQWHRSLYAALETTHCSYHRKFKSVMHSTAIEIFLQRREKRTGNLRRCLIKLEREMAEEDTVHCQRYSILSHLPLLHPLPPPVEIGHAASLPILQTFSSTHLAASPTQTSKW